MYSGPPGSYVYPAAAPWPPSRVTGHTDDMADVLSFLDYGYVVEADWLLSRFFLVHGLEPYRSEWRIGDNLFGRLVNERWIVQTYVDGMEGDDLSLYELAVDGWSA